MCVVHVLYCDCNFVCCVLFWELRVVLCFFLCIVVPQPPDTNPFAVNINNNNNQDIALQQITFIIDSGIINK
jgi:hypothetical protein